MAGPNDISNVSCQGPKFMRVKACFRGKHGNVCVPVKLKENEAPTVSVLWKVPIHHGLFLASKPALNGSGVNHCDWSA